MLVVLQAVALLIERSGCDVRTAINTLQLLARQQGKRQLPAAAAAAAGTTNAGSSCQAVPPKVRITAAAVTSSGALGLKDVSLTALGVLDELVAGASKPQAAVRLQQLAAAQGLWGGSSSATPVTAAAAAQAQLQQQYNQLLDLGEHDLVSTVLLVDIDLAAAAGGPYLSAGAY